MDYSVHTVPVSSVCLFVFSVIYRIRWNGMYVCQDVECHSVCPTECNLCRCLCACLLLWVLISVL